MAVYNPVWNEETKTNEFVESYKGCVLDTYERNGYHDSDFFAVCWDEEKQKVVDVMYDTTRCGGYGSAYIDATEETVRKAYRYHWNNSRKFFDEIFNIKMAQTVEKDDWVEVVRGRKVPKGTLGVVTWTGRRYNTFSGKTEDRVRIVTATGNDYFLPLEYVQVVGWEDKLITGKKRKEYIRFAAIDHIPARYRKLFERRYYV